MKTLTFYADRGVLGELIVSPAVTSLSESIVCLPRVMDGHADG